MAQFLKANLKLDQKSDTVLKASEPQVRKIG